MKFKYLLTLFFSTFLVLFSWAQSKSILVEAESFKDRGGWFIDQQSMDIMGSPYLIAHGMGTPVKVARTMVKFPVKGNYYVYVRTRNWTAPWSNAAAGKFQIKIGDQILSKTFGQDNKDWHWNQGGKVKIKSNDVEISLHDLTGFNGRVDALYFTKNKNDIPPNQLVELDHFRIKKLGLNQNLKSSKFDFVVIGGGIAGTCAALSAARLGLKVALIQNRPIWEAIIAQRYGFIWVLELISNLILLWATWLMKLAHKEVETLNPKHIMKIRKNLMLCLMNPIFLFSLTIMLMRLL